MKVVASQPAVVFVSERGGQLFVWSKSSRCCRGGMTFLEASTQRDDRRAYRRVPADGIELYVDLSRLPEELDIDVSGRFHRKLHAYWEGCAWVT